MVAAASWVFDTGVQDHRAEVLECPPAELAGEIAGNVAVEQLMATNLHNYLMPNSFFYFPPLPNIAPTTARTTAMMTP